MKEVGERAFPRSNSAGSLSYFTDVERTSRRPPKERAQGRKEIFYAAMDASGKIISEKNANEVGKVGRAVGHEIERREDGDDS